jgi:hypothetical protein
MNWGFVKLMGWHKLIDGVSVGYTS